MTTPSDHNPYQPPQSNVTPPPNQEDGGLIDGGQSISVENVFAWIGSSWALFKSSPGIWILILIVMFAVNLVMGLVPILGAIANSLLTPVFLGGILLGCKALDDGEPLEVAHLFAGFKEKAGQLVMVGLLQFALSIAIVILAVIIVAIFVGSTLFQFFNDPSAATAFFAEQGIKVILLGVLGLFVLFIPLVMVSWFAAPLVVFHNLSAATAMVQSFKGCSRNLFQLILCAILFMVLFILGCIPILLGLLIVVPMFYGSIYVSYKDIYLQK